MIQDDNFEILMKSNKSLFQLFAIKNFTKIRLFSKFLIRLIIRLNIALIINILVLFLCRLLWIRIWCLLFRFRIFLDCRLSEFFKWDVLERILFYLLLFFYVVWVLYFIGGILLSLPMNFINITTLLLCLELICYLFD